ncbi:MULTISPECIES: winged helix-turn-helix transcriptional regulator [Brucella/Ochrobactrum group]|uniref:Helix-turn-helix domain-containing protein n=2 Tax=Ochrobactrum TaxID=528 RepID=A0ABD5JZ79_9HYPH|nr:MULTISPECIES: helix-turn-helix domain-containing protein [Brucella]MCI0999917.1 helix-turn-helix transcriptional regulator [Ochrobactrum sp. C6C9]RRD24269.1 transcriptional regulator [Brucellaceae bacterium VT-16-1752]WHT41767.1 helix-turn-helix domain-containing protein [Ochrobactrum sp. SSR]MDX4073575.1 helix-turn-helix domain-containing protein [Brucella sp. NBRC 113783]NNU62112.1 helix-turn-helix transcriptional regulator [[Ochrobactrum] soli]
MVRKKSLKGDYCPSARALDVIGDWWSLLIVREAFDDVTRFSAFQKNLGIARNILAERLRKLTGEGILESVPDPNGGAHQEYRLTAKGRDLLPVVVALRQWGEKHLFTPEEPHSRLVDSVSGHDIAKLDVRAQDGRVLSVDDVVLIKVREDDL